MRARGLGTLPPCRGACGMVAGAGFWFWFFWARTRRWSRAGVRLLVCVRSLGERRVSAAVAPGGVKSAKRGQSPLASVSGVGLRASARSTPIVEKGSEWFWPQVEPPCRSVRGSALWGCCCRHDQGPSRQGCRSHGSERGSEPFIAGALVVGQRGLEPSALSEKRHPVCPP